MQKFNKYIKNIGRVEFTVNNSCTGKCRHCSAGRLSGGQVIDDEKAAQALKDVSQVFHVESIMTFGGEALLYPEKVCRIHKMAGRCGIPHRQLITNGCFSRDAGRIIEVAKMLEESGVNEIMLSIDCFHEEFLPLEWVRTFAEALAENFSGRFRLHPAWVRDEKEDNPYNHRTRECLAFFDDLGLEQSSGNVISPSGNAVKNLSEYFEKKPLNINFRCGDAIYSTKLDAVEEIMIGCNGDVMPCRFPIGNINEKDILDILSLYDPYQNEYTKALLEKGIKGLVDTAGQNGIAVNIDEYYTPCAVCKAIARQVIGK